MRQIISTIVSLIFTAMSFGLSAAESYPAGTRIIITEVHPDDSDYEDRHDFLCYRAIVAPDEEIKTSSIRPGWWSGRVQLLEGPAVSSSARVSEYFQGFKFELDSAPRNSADPVLNQDMSMALPALDFGNMSFDVDLRFVPNAEGRLLFEVTSYRLKCTTKGR